MRPAPTSVAALVLAAAALAGCADPGAPQPDVVATFYPLAWLAGEIAGEDLTVGTLVPPGVEPHDWEPTSADLTRIAGARLLVIQGAGFEPWLPGLLASLGERAPSVADTTGGLPLVAGEHDEGADEPPADDGADDPRVDPHTWLDPVLFAQQAAAAGEAMAQAFPEDADGIRNRTGDVQARLRALDEAYAEGLATCELDVIVASHDAYTYMARRHGFEVVAISGLSPEAEPSPQDVSRAIEAAREHNVTIIFFEDLVSPRVAEIVAEEVGAQTRVLSPVEGVPAGAPPGTDYMSLMRENLAHLREAMRCE